MELNINEINDDNDLKTIQENNGANGQKEAPFHDPMIHQLYSSYLNDSDSQDKEKEPGDQSHMKRIEKDDLTIEGGNGSSESGGDFSAPTGIVTNVTSPKKSEECIELKNIKYKTMLYTGVPLKETSSTNNLEHLEEFLEKEKNNNKNEQWCKLDKTVKTQKLLQYLEVYKKEKDLNEEETEVLLEFFKDCLDKKKLVRVKDVIYDKTSGEIKEIPGLMYNKNNKRFTLKKVEKHVSTLKSVPAKKSQTSGSLSLKKKVTV